MKIIKLLFSALLLMIIGVIIYGVLYLAQIHQSITPLVDKIVAYQPKLTTKIYDRQGRLIANIFEGENRDYINYDEIPPRAIEALLAIEDTAFFEHPGINIDAIMRAVFKDIKARKFVEGASTITQQLVKNMVLTRQKKIERKLKEILIALDIERRLSKEQILERYFNQVYFGHGYYGFKTASLGYFHKDPKELSLKEIAILVGLPRAPSFYDPTKHYEHAIKRADRVISRMYELGWIDEKEFTDALQEQPLVFNDTLTKNRAPYIVDEVLRRFKRLLPNFKSAGYQIYTTIDLDYQYLAKKYLKEGYENLIQRGRGYNYSTLNGAMVVLKPSSGEVLALVGGVDYKKSPFNRATQAKRQPGSAFKPFIYQIALDFGYSQMSKVADIAKTYKFKEDYRIKVWQPKNYEKNFEGEMILKDALIHSRNLATINLVEDIGLERIYKRLKRFGFENLPYDLSLSLGSITLSPLKLAGFYTLFSNYGTKVEPRIVLKIFDAKGGSVYRSRIKRDALVEPKQSFLMIDILRDVVKRGTGRKARVRGVEVAGKTGTTNNYVDAWFCGFTPDIEVVVWYGQDDNTPLKRGEAGGRASAPVVGKFIKTIYTLHPELKRHFKVPKGVFKTFYQGRVYYFTDISKPPSQGGDGSVDEKLLF